MITRRDFFKWTAASGVLATAGYNQEAKAGIKQILPDRKFCFEAEKQIPLLCDVDIVVVGGSARAVEAASAAARNGAKVFLVCPLPYLGEEICGTLAQYEGLNRTPQNISHHYFYGVEGSLKTSLSVKLLKDSPEPPTPLYMKKVLEDELIDNGVDFLYSSLFTNVLTDGKGKVSGVVITNRSGRQAIRAKEVIDATHTAEVAKAAGASLLPDGIQTTEFRFRVVGNNVTPKGTAKAEILPYAAKHNGKSYQVTRYTLQSEADPTDYAALMEIEQQLRDQTFDPDQVDSSDCIEFLPPYTVEAKESFNGIYEGIRKLPLGVFRPKSVEGVTLLNPCCQCSRAVREALSITEMMLAGEIIGLELAKQVKQTPQPASVSVGTCSKLAEHYGEVREILTPLRMKNGKETVTAPKGALPVWGTYDVIVLGGGTAGAPAGISASKFGAKTLVLDYLHGLGGTGTFGMIGCYWDGYREGYTDVIDRGVRAMAPLDHPRQIKEWKSRWTFDWKTEWYRKTLREAGGEMWFGVMGCGAVVKNGKVEGLVVTTPYGRGVVLCKLLVDSSGSADIAIAAGGKYNFIDKHSPAVQGAGLPKVDPGDSYNNTDWAFIDDTDVLDVTRVFIQGKRKHEGFFDVGKLPQTRERRRIVGEYEVTTYDVINHRTYEDTISYHKSSFDTHGITVNPLFTLCPPERRHMIYEADVPLRSLLPAGLDGILVTGLGACADRDAMPVIRMQPCLQNQGYSVGYMAAQCIKQNKAIREIDLKKIQKYLVEIGNLPPRVLTDKEFKGFSDKELAQAIRSAADNYKGAEKLLTQPAKAIRLSNRQLTQTSDPAAQLIYASISSILGDKTNAAVLGRHISSKPWDTGWHYTGMGQFGECMGRMDAHIMALGNSKSVDQIDCIVEKASRLDPSSDYSHIRAVSEAFEAMASPKAVEVLHRLLTMNGMQGHALSSYLQSRTETIPGKVDVLARNKALKEVTLARALYYCGDKNGLGRSILEMYANGLERIYGRYAEESLERNS